MNDPENLDDFNSEKVGETPQSPLDKYYASKTKTAMESRRGNGMPENMEQKPKSKEETDSENNANTIKNLFQVGKQAHGTPVALVAPVADVVDDATGGRVTKTGGAFLQKALKKVPGGQLIQKASNKLSESGIGDGIGNVANLAGGKVGAANAAGKAASGVGKAANTANGAGKAANGAGNNAANPMQNALKNKMPQAPSGNGEKNATQDAAKALWKKLPLKVKLILIGAAAFLLLLIIIIMIITSLGGAAAVEEQNQTGIADTYDYNNTIVFLSYPDGSLMPVLLPDYVKGVIYYEYGDSIQDEETLKALIVTYKSLILSQGAYNAANKEMHIPSSSDGLKYCDIYNGCNEIDGYVYSNAGLDNVDPQIPPMSEDLYFVLESAYNATIYELLLPAGYEGVFTAYDFENAPEIPSKNDLDKYQDSGKSYDEILNDMYDSEEWGSYNLKDHVVTYEYTDSGNSYWWPIGSKQATNGDIYGGTPVSIRITSKFGYRTDPVNGTENTMHNGIDIGASCGVPVIATRGGTVIESYESASCGNLVKIDHGDGTYSRYCHMKDDTIIANEVTVKQGQKIGEVGNTGESTGCHLHFEIWEGSDRVDPENYVSASNTRPKGEIVSSYAEGTNNTQTVCLSLKQSGYSDDAVIALMSNIYAESGFKTGAIGDSGTSYGLCQWHNGRKARLEEYCGSALNTVECQLKYLTYELQSSYTSVYQNLLSNSDAQEKTVYFCKHFEVPANAAISCLKRAENNNHRYKSYVENGCK